MVQSSAHPPAPCTGVVYLHGVSQMHDSSQAHCHQPRVVDIACRSSDGPSPAQTGSSLEADSGQVASAEDRLGLGVERSRSGTELRNMQPRAKVMAVAEGLEEELFVAEAYRHDAEARQCTHCSPNSVTGSFFSPYEATLHAFIEFQRGCVISCKLSSIYCGLEGKRKGKY